MGPGGDGVAAAGRAGPGGVGVAGRAGQGGAGGGGAADQVGQGGGTGPGGGRAGRVHYMAFAKTLQRIRIAPTSPSIPPLVTCYCRIGLVMNGLPAKISELETF